MLNRQMHSTLVKVKRALTGKKTPRKGEGNDDGTGSVDSSPTKRGGYGSDADSTTPNSTPTSTPTKRKGLSVKLHRKGHHDSDHHHHSATPPALPSPGLPPAATEQAAPLGTLLRGPLNRVEGATATPGGMVFGRSLEDCVRDTRAESGASDGADGTTLASTRPVADSGLDARLIPALVLRSVQYLYKYGVKEEGLFRCVFTFLPLERTCLTRLFVGLMDE